MKMAKAKVKKSAKKVSKGTVKAPAKGKMC